MRCCFLMRNKASTESVFYPPPPYKPYNVTYQTWTTRWWRWLLELPKHDSPAIGNSNCEDCAKFQGDQVWFLTGTLGGAAERRCNVSAGKDIFFPIVSEWCSKAEFDKAGKDLVKFCRFIIEDWVTEKEVIFDGKHMLRGRQLNKYLVQSKPFKFKLKQDNIFGLKAGNTECVSCGYWLMIRKEALSGKRDYTLHFSAKEPSHFETNVTYTLTIR
jgi:hypothetical protein